MENFTLLMALGLATAAISVTISKSNIGAPLRRGAFAIHDSLGAMVSCYYCIAHWIALGFALVYQQPAANLGLHFVNLIVLTFATVAVAAIFAGLIIALKKFSQH